MASHRLTRDLKKRILSRHGPDFILRIRPTPMLLAVLVSQHVILEHMKEDILDLVESSRQANALLGVLPRASVLQFVNFCIILHEELEFRDIIADWGLNIHDLRRQRDEMLRMYEKEDQRKGKRKHPSAWPDDLRDGIRCHHDFYNRTLMIGRLFDIKELNLAYDMEKCFIQVVATSDELLSKPVVIHPDDMLKPWPGKSAPKTALLSGDPGAGKSSIVRYYAYKCSKLEAGTGAWDLIVILDMSTLKVDEGLSHKEQIRQAIRKSLAGSEEDKSAIMCGLDDGSLNVLIVPDGLDECRDRTMLEMLKELIRACWKGELGYTVLATCRSGLCPIDKTLFNRCMKTDGFSIAQGLEYVRRFYNEIIKPNDESIFDYIVDNTQDLAHILPNPLCTHILSVVTADGTLKLTEGKILKKKELFEAMEESMKRRQQEKFPSGTKKSPGQYFHNMSLYALLKNIRTFDEDFLEKFTISKDSAYLTFMTKRTERKLGTITEYWTFCHEMFGEYFASCALEAQSNGLRGLHPFLLYLSYRKEFRNTQKLLFSALSRNSENDEILSNMIRATLLLQSQLRVDTALLTEIHKKLKSLVTIDDPFDILLPSEKNISDEVKSLAEQLLHDISSIFETEESRKQGLFHAIIKNADNSDLLKHLNACLSELPDGHRSQIVADSIGCLLPSTHGNTTVYRTGGTGWSAITEREDEVYGQSHCPGEMAEAFHQHQQQYSQPWSNNHKTLLTLQIPYSWGVLDDPKPDEFDCKAWSDLLDVINEGLTIADWLNVDLGQAYHSIDGFLDWLLKARLLKSVLARQDGGWRDVEVAGGHIDFKILHKWRKHYVSQNEVRVVLKDTAYQNVNDANAIAQYQTMRARRGGKILTCRKHTEIWSSIPSYLASWVANNMPTLHLVLIAGRLFVMVLIIAIPCVVILGLIAYMLQKMWASF